MALCYTGLFGNLSLIRLYGVKLNRIPNGLYSPNTFCMYRTPLCRHYSSSKVRGVGRNVGAKVERLNNKYEEFLKIRFPRFFQLYHTFVEGFKLLFRDAKEVSRIKAKMYAGRIRFQDLPYREMEKLRQVRRDMIKAIPLIVLSIPPLANYLVFVLMYFFPRQLLIPHFWTPAQQVAFRGLYHRVRARHHRPVLNGLQDAGRPLKGTENHLTELCAKVQSGESPTVSEILAVRGLFSKAPLGMTRLRADQMRRISPLLFLTPRLPAILVRRRLRSHGLELLQLDRALAKLGPHQLSDAEIREACYVRGINSYSLNMNQCRAWLSQWLQVSSSLKDSEVSLLLHTIVLLSANYPTGADRKSEAM